MNTVMDTGSVTFGFTLAVLESWNSSGRAYIDSPKNYRADLGDNIRC